MSVDPKNGSGGTDGGTGGAADETQDDNKPKVVSAELYEKSVTQEKNLRKRLQEFEKKEKEREEALLKEQNKYKELVDAKEKELADVQEKLSAKDKRIANSMKLSAFFKHVSGKIDQEYWDLIDLSKIAYDADGEVVDEKSAQDYAKEFEKKYAKVIDKPNEARMPNDAARGGAAMGFEAEIKAAKTQRELDAVMIKYGKM